MFADLDATSETLQIQISPDQPYFRLTTRGEAGTTQIECPRDSGVVEAFACSQVQIHWCVMQGKKKVSEHVTCKTYTQVQAQAAAAVGEGAQHCIQDLGVWSMHGSHGRLTLLPYQIRMNQWGTLSLQYLVNQDVPTSVFIEYLVRRRGACVQSRPRCATNTPPVSARGGGGR